MRHWSLFTLILSLLALSLPAQVVTANDSDKPCVELFALLAEDLEAPKQEFLDHHTNAYTFELPYTKVKDQCQMGNCWIYGTLSNKETTHLAKTGEKIELSEQYLILKSLQENIEGALSTPGYKVVDGGFFDEAERLVNQYGVLPAEVWQPRVPFEKNPHAKRLMNFINNRIAHYHIDVANKVDTPEKLRIAATKDINHILEGYIGKPPQKFMYKGEFYSSPKDFSERKFLNDGNLMQIVPNRDSSFPSPLKSAIPADGDSNVPDMPRGKFTRISLPMDKVEREIVEAIQSGKSVGAGVEWTPAFIDNKSGIMSIEAFHTPPGYKPVPMKYRSSFGIGGGGHQIEIIGVELDADGRVKKFKIKNSYGEDTGDKGIFHMYPDYFHNYLKYIYVKKP